MSQFFQIHPDNPQNRLIQQAVELLKSGGVVVYPTDSAYALGAVLGNKGALEKIKRIRKLDDKHNFTLVCRDLSEIGTYAKVDNQAYRLLKMLTPGAYTFILPASSEVPRRMLHPKRKTVGIRVPDNRIAMALAEALGEPMVSTSLIMPNDDMPLMDPYEIRDLLEHEVALVIDGGYCGMEATTVLDLTNGVPELVRQGAGSIEGVI
ncbi:MAG: L-threonylcarbamoyladenylate synthase [Pontibacterium sp.]